MKIRDAKILELKEIMKLWIKFQEEHLKYGIDIIIEARAKQAEQKIRRDFDKIKILVVVEKSKIIGFGIANVVNAKNKGFKNNFGYISEVYVLPKYRGKGIGTKLINGLIKWLKPKKIKKIDIVVFIDNPAKKLYEKIGFKPIKQTMSKMVKN